MKKKALITGITGQDGSYLAEFLLSKGYEVHGLRRRSSAFNTQRIDHIYVDPHSPDAKLFLHYGDLTDSSQMTTWIYEIKPDEVYHLGAQSHVGVSFETPEYTADVVGLGTTRILEAIRKSGVKSRFYQASSSEMFGSAPAPQNEKTPFHPRSPYGVAKVYAYWITVNYRESYGLFACNGILFNHETVASFMPMFLKKIGEEQLDIKPICEIVSFDESKKMYQSREVSGISVWGKEGWVEVRHASAYPHDVRGDNKKPRFINSRSGAFMATSSHVGFMEGGEEIEVGRMTVGDNLEIISLPNPSYRGPRFIGEKEAELLGMMVGDGCITYKKKGIGLHGKFTNSCPEIRDRFSSLWKTVTGGQTSYYPSKSGFNPENIVGQLRLNGGNEWLRSIDIYNCDRTKRVPKVILNAEPQIMLAFLRGYNATDGLKRNPCVYEFKNFKTNSATLAMGLWYLIDQATMQDVNLTVETKPDGRIFYSLNLLSTVENHSKEVSVRTLSQANVSEREISRKTGISRTFIRKIQNGSSACALHHFRKNASEIKKIIETPDYQGWFYDLETSSGEFHCGVGKVHVHNSPRRGETFVTRKVTRAISKILSGRQDAVYLGNLDAKRDWGFAPDYVEAMWMMLQQSQANDYVIGTGEVHSVRQFVEKALAYAGAQIEWTQKGVDEKAIFKGFTADYQNDRSVLKPGDAIVRIDPKYFRPSEVDFLQADASQSKKALNWSPKIKFEELVRVMMDYDMSSEGLKTSNRGLAEAKTKGFGWTSHHYSLSQKIKE